MTRARRDGLFFFLMGIAVFVVFGFGLQHTAADAMSDFKVNYYDTRCLLRNCDPYNKTDILNFYRAEFGNVGAKERSQSYTLAVNMPTTFLVIAPIGMMPRGLAYALWTALSAASLGLAGFLIWNFGADYAPILSGALIGLLLASSAIVLGNGNPAGLVIGLGVIGVWCLVKQRFVSAGILCLAIALAMKPHDVGLVWLYFLLAGGVHRRNALQTLAVTSVLGLAAVMWVSHVAPNWIPEMRSNLAEISARGGNNDPGPAGLTSRSKTPEVIIDLQSAVSVFKDDPRIYDKASYLVCGTLLLVWSIATLKSGHSAAFTWFALATVAPLTMLVTYHRAYDAKLLLLTVPACAMLWAEGSPIRWVALLVNTAALTFTGEIPLAFLIPLTKNLHADTAGLFGKIQTVVLMRPASLSLLAMAVFYLWVYVRRAANRCGAGLSAP